MELRKIEDMDLDSRKKSYSNKINYQKARPWIIAIGIVVFLIAVILVIRYYG